ncbi:hypothetical protein BGZ93_010893 [Podila epicladia]|nr:hypothetical protein BGZ93_010893 [Podila epicladia]
MAQFEKLPFVLPHADDLNTHTTTSNKQQKYHKYFVLATCSAYLVLDVVASYLDLTVNNNQNHFSFSWIDILFLVVINAYALNAYALGKLTPLTHRRLSYYVFCVGWLLPLFTVLGPYAVDWAKGRNPSFSFEYGSLGAQVLYCRDEVNTPERYGEQSDLATSRAREHGLPIMETISVCVDMMFPKSKLLVPLLSLGVLNSAGLSTENWKRWEKLPSP